MAGGGRSTKGGNDGASGRAPLVSGRRMKKSKEDMTGGSHIQDKYLGVTLADRPPIPNRPSAIFLCVTSTEHVYPPMFFAQTSTNATVMYKYKCVPNNLGFFKLKPNSIGSQLFPDLEKLVPIGQTKHMSIIASKVVVGYHQDTRTRTSLISMTLLVL